MTEIETVPILTKARLDFNEQITVLVGEEAEAFVLPKTLAVEDAPYIGTALDNGSKDAKKSTVRLPDADVDTFRVFVQWLYTGEVVLLDPEDAKKDDKGTARYLSLTKLYKLGVDLYSIRLRNVAIDSFIGMKGKVSGAPNELVIAQAFEFTSEHSTLQRLLADIFQHCEDVVWLNQKGSELPHGFLLAVYRERMLLQGKKPPMLKYSERCKYHEHTSAFPKAASCTI